METGNGEQQVSKVEITEEGMLKITGHIIYKDLKRDISDEREEVVLCLCGLSQNKPFCDNSHNDRR